MSWILRWTDDNINLRGEFFFLRRRTLYKLKIVSVFGLIEKKIGDRTFIQIKCPWRLPSSLQSCLSVDSPFLNSENRHFGSLGQPRGTLITYNERSTTLKKNIDVYALKGAKLGANQTLTGAKTEAHGATGAKSVFKQAGSKLETESFEVTSHCFTSKK